MTDILDRLRSRRSSERRPWPRSFAAAWRRGGANPATKTGAGRVSVAQAHELADCPVWAQAFADQRKDRRYYELVERTLDAPFEHRYFVLDDERRRRCAVQPFFLHDQDLLAGLGERWAGPVAAVRRLWPRFMRLRTLMVGCAAGEAHLDGADEAARRAHAQTLVRELTPHARALRASLIVLKEFPARYREALACTRAHAFTRVPSLPMTRLNIGYADFDEFMARALSRATRKDFRRKFKAAAKAAPIEMSVLTDVSDIIDEIYPLYLQVYERSTLHFEKLTRDYLCELGRRMPDRARFFVWRQEGRIIAFNLCMVHANAIYDEYIGFDYSVALELHLYHYTLRDMLNWAMAQGIEWYCSNSLNYDPKLHLRSELQPLDLYVRHTSRLANVALKFALPMLAPTRYDKTLPRFANYQDLWGEG